MKNTMKSTTDVKSKILSKETVFKSKYFKIENRTIEENGKTFNKDYVIKTRAVYIIPLDENGEIYFAKQFRSALEKTTLELFAGHMQEGEDPLEAAKRELSEESGLIAKNWKHLARWNVSASMVAVIDIFVATELTKGELSQEEDENVETIKLDLNSALERIENGEIDTTPHVAAILLFDRLKKEGKFNL